MKTKWKGYYIKMATKISFFNLKGGIGKTTTTANVAHVLAQLHEKKVLLVDLDGQCNLSTLFVRPSKEYSDTDQLDSFATTQLIQDLCQDKHVSMFEDLKGTISDVFTTNMDIRDIIYTTRFENIDIIPSDLNFFFVDNMIKQSEDLVQHSILRKRLEPVDNEYDYILFDLNPSLNTTNLNGLVASDYVMIPLLADFFSLQGKVAVVEFMKTARQFNPKLEVLGEFLVKYSKNNIHEIFDFYLGVYLDKFLKNIHLRSSTLAANQTLDKKPIFKIRSYNSGFEPKGLAKDFIELTNYIVENT